MTRQSAFVADVDRFQILPGQLMDDAVLVGGLLLAAQAGTDGPAHLENLVRP